MAAGFRLPDRHQLVGVCRSRVLRCFDRIPDSEFPIGESRAGKPCKEPAVGVSLMVIMTRITGSGQFNIDQSSSLII